MVSIWSFFGLYFACISCTAFWPSFVAKTACSKAISAIFAGMACWVTGAGAGSGGVAGVAGGVAGVGALPAVVFQSPPSSGSKTKFACSVWLSFWKLLQ